MKTPAVVAGATHTLHETRHPRPVQLGDPDRFIGTVHRQGDAGDVVLPIVRPARDPPRSHRLLADMSACHHARMLTVALVSQKGGAGKTTIAINLAIASELAGRPALVVDLDPQASAATWGDSREAEAPVAD